MLEPEPEPQSNISLYDEMVSTDGMIPVDRNLMEENPFLANQIQTEVQQNDEVEQQLIDVVGSVDMFVPRSHAYLIPKYNKENFIDRPSIQSNIVADGALSRLLVPREAVSIDDITEEQVPEIKQMYGENTSTFAEKFQASLALNNSLYSYFGRKFAEESLGYIPGRFDPDFDLRKTYDNLNRPDVDYKVFIGSKSYEEVIARLARVDEHRRNTKILLNGGPSSLLASLLSEATDVLYYVPLLGWWSKARSMKRFAQLAASSSGVELAKEYVIHQTNMSRTSQETIFNVLLAAGIVPVLDYGLQQYIRSRTKKIPNDPDNPNPNSNPNPDQPEQPSPDQPDPTSTNQTDNVTPNQSDPVEVPVNQAQAQETINIREGYIDHLKKVNENVIEDQIAVIKVPINKRILSADGKPQTFPSMSVFIRKSGTQNTNTNTTTLTGSRDGDKPVESKRMFRSKEDWAKVGENLRLVGERNEDGILGIQKPISISKLMILSPAAKLAKSVSVSARIFNMLLAPHNFHVIGDIKGIARAESVQDVITSFDANMDTFIYQISDLFDKAKNSTTNQYNNFVKSSGIEQEIDSSKFDIVKSKKSKEKQIFDRLVLKQAMIPRSNVPKEIQQAAELLNAEIKKIVETLDVDIDIKKLLSKKGRAYDIEKVYNNNGQFIEDVKNTVLGWLQITALRRALKTLRSDKNIDKAVLADIQKWANEVNANTITQQFEQFDKSAQFYQQAPSFDTKQLLRSNVSLQPEFIKYDVLESLTEELITRHWNKHNKNLGQLIQNDLLKLGFNKSHFPDSLVEQITQQRLKIKSNRSDVFVDTVKFFNSIKNVYSTIKNKVIDIPLTGFQQRQLINFAYAVSSNITRSYDTFIDDIFTNGKIMRRRSILNQIKSDDMVVSDQFIDKWLQSSAQETLQSIINEYAPKVGIKKVLGSKGITSLDDLIDLRKLEDSAIIEYNNIQPNSKLHNQILNASTSDVESLTLIWNRLHGIVSRDQLSSTSKTAKFIRGTKQATTLSLLPGVLISSLPDVGRVIMANGFANAIKGYAAQFKKAKLIKGANKREMTLLAAAGERTNQLLMQSRAGIDDPTKLNAGWESSFQNLMSFTGLPIWNQIQKTAVAYDYLDKIFQRGKLRATSSNPKPLSKRDTTMLATFGLNEELIDRLYPLLQKHGIKTENGDYVILPNIEAWESEHVQLANQLRVFLKRAADFTISTAQASSLPGFFDNKIASLATQFNSFAALTHLQTFVPGIQKARMYNPAGYQGILATLVIAGGMLYLKQAIRDSSRRQSEKNPVEFDADLISNATDYSGLLTALFYLNKAAMAATGSQIGIEPALSAIFGEQVESRKMYNQNALNFIVGPWLSWGTTIPTVFDAVLQPSELSDGEIRRALLQIPMAKHPLIQPFITNPAIEAITD